MTDSTYKKDFMYEIPLTGNSLHKSEMEYHGNLDILLDGYSTLILWEELTFVAEPKNWKSKMWWLHFLVSKVSSATLNISLVTLINPYFILIIIIMGPMLSDWHGVVIKLKTTKPIIVYNAIKMRIMLELLT